MSTNLPCCLHFSTSYSSFRVVVAGANKLDLGPFRQPGFHARVYVVSGRQMFMSATSTDASRPWLMDARSRKQKNRIAVYNIRHRPVRGRVPE